MSQPEQGNTVGDRFGLRVCACGQVARPYGVEESPYTTRCGRDGRHNMRYDCPFRVLVVEVISELEDRRS